MPNNTEIILNHLRKISPIKESNSDIVVATGIKPHQQVFQITSSLYESNKIQGIKTGKEWLYWVNNNVLTEEHVISALREIDDKGIKSDERSSTYDLIHNAKRYPSKLVFSLAHKYLNGKIRGRDTFSGGEDTECFNTLRKLGFIIERKDFVIELLKKFIRQAEEAEDLTTRSYPRKFCDLDMKVGFGQGNFARVPWISFTGFSQTVQNGIYPVYLFYKSIGVLILAYGVSETNEPTKKWEKIDSKEKIKDYLRREFNHAPERYGESYVHSVYKLPLDFGDNSLTANLDLLIHEYHMCMSDKLLEPKHWIFQGNPKSFDIRKYIHEVTEITWSVNQSQNQIKEGQTGFMWEAGPDAGIIAKGTILSNPEILPVVEDEKKYFQDPDTSFKENLRVKISIDEVLKTPLKRKDLLNHPVLKNLGIIKFANATNFMITNEENEAIRKLISVGDIQHELVLIGTAKQFHTKFNNVTKTISENDGWACWWSFFIDEAAQEKLKKPFYLYLNAGQGRFIYRLLISEYLTVRGSQGIISPWPDITDENERNVVRVGDKQNQVCKTWLKVIKAEKLSPELSLDEFVPYEPLSNEGNMLNQNAFGYAILENEPSTEIMPTIVEPILDPDAIASSFSTALNNSHVNFGANHDHRVRAFVSSLMTKPLVILTGLSGSGKTQIAIRFGEWLGKERMLVSPVRPDWTGAEALFGYEDALKPVVNGRASWAVPDTLQFFLRASSDPYYPYLLVLDEMNLAHVERYFADVLSGMESNQPCLPNLVRDPDGFWRLKQNAPDKITLPNNVFIVGTVNVDETTYMFSPKVLDRSNTFEFRVTTDDLADDYIKPIECELGELGLIRGFLEIGRDQEWHRRNGFTDMTDLSQQLRHVHNILAAHGFEFGHRVFYESQRFAAIYSSTGATDSSGILDLIVMQKLLPRLHGSRRRLEALLRTFAEYCFTNNIESSAESPVSTFEPEDNDVADAKLPISFDKLNRMLHSLRANQFTSFTE